MVSDPQDVRALVAAAALCAAVPLAAAVRWVIERYVPQRLSYVGLLAALAVCTVAACIVVEPPVLLVLTVALAGVLTALAVIDLAVLRLPDPLTLPLAAAGLIATWWRAPDGLPDHLIGAAAGYLVLAGLAWLYRRLRGREGLGLGDAKLLMAAGAWLGWRALPWVVLLAALAGLLWALIRQARGRPVASGEPIAFGAPLCASFYVCWLASLGLG